MIEKPDLEDKKIVDCTRDAFGLNIHMGDIPTPGVDRLLYFWDKAETRSRLNSNSELKT